MLTVKGHKLLVKHLKFEERVELPEALKNSNFEIVLPTDQAKREEVASEIGVVVDIGNTCWKAFDSDKIGWEPWCKVGDTILFARYSGKLVEDPVSKERFMIINDEDVQAIVDGLKNPFED